MPIIKRYNNRKLYDTHAKRYVTLLDLADMIRRGDDITVLDHADGQDITSQIQAQIIFEQERQTGNSLPNTVLTNLIQASNQTLKQLRTTLLPLDRAAQLDSEIERRMQLLIERGDIGVKQGNRILEKLLAAQPATRSPQELKITRALEKRGTPTRGEIQTLSEQISALSNELKNLNRKEIKPKRKTDAKNATP
ncbi:MAG: polyhydroxyalkanoate synthesis repressor PhaR [Chloroflexota bacterium]|nr:MAG: polyhydroxyalkanoate synthesis repressor PhaR [Chloroflexota bacterium]